MMLPKPEDAIHRAQMYRLLVEMIDSPLISQSVYFKGGSCAAMLGFLDRYSVDLDFDLKKESDNKVIDQQLRKIFKKLELEIAKKSHNSLFYLLKYQAKKGERNNLKLSIVDKPLKSNIYEAQYLREIDRFCNCQTIATMFANKLVAIIDRYKKRGDIAGRDIYDIHYFFQQAYDYEKKVIFERTAKKPLTYLKELKKFIGQKINEKILSQDLNFLLPDIKFQKIRKVLKNETIMFLQDQINLLS